MNSSAKRSFLFHQPSGSIANFLPCTALILQTLFLITYQNSDHNPAVPGTAFITIFLTPGVFIANKSLPHLLFPSVFTNKSDTFKVIKTSA